MSLGIDTAVLVRLLIGEPADLAAKAEQRLLKAHLARESVVASDLVIAEAYHALKHHYEIAPADIRRSLLSMLTSGLVQPEVGSAVLGVLHARQSGKSGLVDRLIQAGYESNGRVTLTFDRQQSRLGKPELIG